MKKFNFYVLIAIIIFVTINLLSVTTIYIITDKNYFNKEEYISFKKRFRKTDEKTVYPHPFFGFNHTYLKPAKDKIEAPKIKKPVIQEIKKEVKVKKEIPTRASNDPRDKT